MNRYKLNWIVEYIKTQSDFPFDVLDVEEDMESVLAYFGIHPELDDEERMELRNELGVLALNSEVAEVARIVGLEQDRELGWIGKTIYPEMFRKGHRQVNVPVGAWLQGLSCTA